MGRKPRIEFQDAIYHVIQRGNNKEYIFNRAADKSYLLSIIEEIKEDIPFQLLGYVIMDNHYHLMVKRGQRASGSSSKHGTYHFPQMKIVINLSPSDLQKKGSHFDLAMAIGLLIESNQIRPKNVQKYGFIGELSLNARIRSCAGVLPMIMAAKESGIKDIIVPKDNIKEASLVQGMNIFGFNTLEEVAYFLEEKNGYQIPLDESPQTEEHIYPIDFSEVQGQDIMLEYIVIAAAGIKPYARWQK